MPAILILAGMLYSSCSTPLKNTSDTVANQVVDAIEIFPKNPFYWQYNGEPILLRGGSKEDNLFNHPDGMKAHLEELKSVGGNYIRNTMSSRNPGNPWPFQKGSNGLYDLDQWDETYWERFENLLKWTSEMDIIVQIEIWDPWDYFKSEASLGYGPENVGWESCPYNPVMNVNYTAEESQLKEEIDYFSKAIASNHLFFSTVPALEDIPVVRKYQEAFVDKILSYTLEYPNVLYCMNNEIGEAQEWGEYWAQYIRDKSEMAGKKVFMTDMRRNIDFSSEEQVSLLHNDELYDFFEISQNSANNDQNHYDQILSIRKQVLDHPKPLNSVKIYGGEIGKWTTSVEEGTRRFWRSVFGGIAAVRFHRPGPSHQYFGLGLSELAKTHIKSIDQFVGEFDIFKSQPSNQLLNDREANEAYCLADHGTAYAVYFPDGGNVSIDLSEMGGELNIKWLNILENSWSEVSQNKTDQQINLQTPGKGHWLVIINGE
ncbi:MAG: putative collagen-binding domain-containing protein [Cyclobacteriaceae bacterium]